MSKNFIKFKNKALMIRLIKSVLIGVAVGLFFAGGFLFLAKFEILKMKPILSLPIGVGTALIAGCGIYFLLRRTDKALARKLDEEYKLHEKVQTMFEFKDEQGAMYELQRQDTEKALRGVSSLWFDVKNIWIYGLCTLIGAGAFTAACVLHPIKEPPVEKPPEAFDISDTEIAAMEELIAYVDESSMQSPYKESISSSLRELLDGLKITTVKTDANALWEQAVDEIYETTDKSSAAVELMDALWSCDLESVKRLAESLNYYEWTKADEWDSFSEELTEFRASFVHMDTVEINPDAEKMATDTAALLLRVESNISLSLVRAGVTMDDGLYQSLTRLATANETSSAGSHLYGFSTLSGLCETIGYTTAQKELDATFAVLGAEIFNALGQHSINTSTGEYVMTRLKSLFSEKIDCRLPAFERPNFYVTSPVGPSDPDEGDGGGQQGGIGEGAVYGSDDLVLDPLTNTYVEYGTILDKYYALMFGKVNDGDYTDEEKAAMEKYFAILYGGFDENEGE